MFEPLKGFNSARAFDGVVIIRGDFNRRSGADDVGFGFDAEDLGSKKS